MDSLSVSSFFSLSFRPPHPSNMRFTAILSGVTAIASSALATAFPHIGRATNQSNTCQFDSANSPSCWGKYSLSTNWYNDGPDTGVIREYWFELVNKTLAPDGVPRVTLSVNGSIPGPTIEADWGDTVVVHVKNSLGYNGTSIHWHGIRQQWSNDQDGVASITQCPVAPGESTTYTWKAQQYGTTWYHSHYSLQAWNGVFGPIVIRGPASAPYDEDKGPIVLSDWTHQTTDELYGKASTGGPPTQNNGLINGLNVYGNGGSRFKTNFESGKSYRLRLVNTAIDTMYKFGIDNHTLTVIANDLVPIVPFKTNMVNVAIGQRYDVIVKADQPPGNYWMRAIPQLTCSSNEMSLNINGIVTYDTLKTVDPTTESYNYTDSCDDMLLESLVPALGLDVGKATVTDIEDVSVHPSNGVFKWTLNNSSFLSEWGQPTLEKILTPGSVYKPEENIVTVNETNEWTYLIVESQLGFPHPIHMHGHDFYIVGQGKSNFTDVSQLNLVRPPRRDVAMLPANGYLAMAFMNDNPGVWLVHCHIGWHTSQGLALQIVERSSDISSAVRDKVALNQTCTAWNNYQSSVKLEQDDSGI
ncbi:multicopper oxidase [Xylaria nigripes]|nr:multicopper oxidase [Xylaria nigripes]